MGNFFENANAGFGLFQNIYDVANGGWSRDLSTRRAASHTAQSEAELRAAQAEEAQRQNQMQADTLAGQNALEKTPWPSVGPQVFSDLQPPAAPLQTLAALGSVLPGVPEGLTAARDAGIKALLKNINPDEWHSWNLKQHPGRWEAVQQIMGPTVKNPAVLPDIWDKKVDAMFPWVARPISVPSNIGQFTGNGGGTSTDGFTMKPIWNPMTGKAEMTKVISPLSEAQKDLLRSDPSGTKGATQSIPEAQQPQAAAFIEARKKNLGEYQDKVGKAPEVVRYLNGSGEQAGMLPMWQEIDDLRHQHVDAGGNWTSNLSPSEITTLVYRTGRIDNPGAIVRDTEFERIAKGLGVLDTIRRDFGKWTEGQTISLPAVQGLYHTMDLLKQTNEKRFHHALISWEPELQERGLDLKDVIHDHRALGDFYKQYGPLVQPGQEEKIQALPPGAAFHDADGNVGHWKGPQADAAAKPPLPPASAAPPVSRPSLPTQSQYAQPMIPTQAKQPQGLGGLLQNLGSLGAAAQPQAPQAPSLPGVTNQMPRAPMTNNPAHALAAMDEEIAKLEAGLRSTAGRAGVDRTNAFQRWSALKVERGLLAKRYGLGTATALPNLNNFQLQMLHR